MHEFTVQQDRTGQDSTTAVVQDSTTAGTALVTCHVPWQPLDTQARETILPLHILRKNRMQLVLT